MPGLIDCHLHITYQGDPDPTLFIKELPSLFAMRATVHARTLLNAGITTIRDAGSPIYADIALRQAVDCGLVPGPRVRACGYGLKMTGGHGDSFYSPIVEIESPGLVDNADQARKVARMNLKMGADHIKILSASGGVMSQGTEPGVAQFTVEEMRAAGKGTYGMKVVAAGELARDVRGAFRWVMERSAVDAMVLGMTSREEVRRNVELIEELEGATARP